MTTTARIERLVASIENDRRSCEQLAARLAGAVANAPWRDDDTVLYLVAVTLDHYYSALESLFERVTRSFEGLPDRSDRWHKELLEGAALALAGVRPAIIAPANYSWLLRLLEFRHFMRHAYAVPLDPDRLLSLSRELLASHPRLGADLDAFIQAMRAIPAS